MKRAVSLMTVSSALVPIVGVISAPLLAQGLGVSGRGELSVATAPGILLAGVVTFGLPEALTYFTAKRPASTRRYLAFVGVLTLLTSSVGVAVVAVAAPTLTSGSASLSTLVILGAVLSIPLLLLSLVRSSAAGLQMWGWIAIERVVSSLFRLALVAGLLVTGQLTVLSALIATTAGPLIGVLVFLPVFRAARRVTRSERSEHARWRAPLVRYALSTWFGSVAGVFLSRINQVLFAPLSDVTQLGLYVVAVTISDVPLITAIAIRDAVFGASSKQQDIPRLATAHRITLLLGLGTSGLIAATVTLWIGPVFGRAFVDAVPTTLVLLLSAVVNIPVFIIGAGLAAAGHPGMRSASLSIALVVNIGLFVVLVPAFGAVGAASSALGSAVAAALFTVVAAVRFLRVSVTGLFVIRRSDLRLLISAAGGMMRRRRSAMGGLPPESEREDGDD